MEQTTRPNYTPLYENGQRVQIRGMAASSIKNTFYSVSVCDRCHSKVAWAKSSKTGKWYVCQTAEYTTPEAGRERFRAVPYATHRCDQAMPTAVKVYGKDGEWRKIPAGSEDLVHEIAIANELGSRAFVAWIKAAS